MRLFIIGILVFILIEIGLLIWIGSQIGVFAVLSIIILTAGLGIIFGRKQGFQTWNNAMQAINQRQAPARAFIDGICIFLGAGLLIAPGFISDIIGILLLIPFTRNLFKLSIAKMLDKMVNRGVVIYRRY
ncbi:FxsA family protein [Oceanobacillus sp. CAU 1775]